MEAIFWANPSASGSDIQPYMPRASLTAGRYVPDVVSRRCHVIALAALARCARSRPSSSLHGTNMLSPRTWWDPHRCSSSRVRVAHLAFVRLRNAVRTLARIGVHFPRGHAALEAPTSSSGSGTRGGFPSVACVLPRWRGRERLLPGLVSLCLSFLILHPLPPTLPLPPLFHPRRPRPLFPRIPSSRVPLSYFAQALTFSSDCLRPRCY
jgi:hypothetical protein